MKRITLKQLRYFEALAKNTHFGHAADACSISQPALSMQIKELEQSLGTVLFERNARLVRLTAFGEDFGRHVRPILQAVDELSDLARASHDTLSGRLRIGVIPTIAPYLLPAILGDLSRIYPELDIRIRETLTERLIQEMANGQLDTAIVALPVSVPSFHETLLFDERFVFVRPECDAHLPGPTSATLASERLLLLEEGHCFRDQALSFCNASPSRTHDGLDGSSLATLVQMVGAGIGVTVIPEMAVEVETRSAPVCVTRFEGVEPSRRIGMIWRKTSPLAEKLGQIAEIVRLAGERCKAAQAAE